ncbi:hypothetical protein GEV43_00920 [Actinomadura sp. J1-007]|nr:hypothetical protein [Actinomadura sp. J1-007]
MFGMGGGGGGGGTETVTTPDPLVSLKRELTRPDDSVVLTYRTDDPAGPDYLRLYALDRFDGDRWTYSALQSSAKDRLSGRTLPSPPGLGGVPARTVTTRVRVRKEVKRMTFLPVPYAPSQVSIKGDWRVHAGSLMVYSLRDSAGGRSYTVRSVRARPTGADLSAARGYPGDVVSHFTSVPRNVPPQIHDLARQITAGATTAHQQAVRLQRWFTQTGGFVYDLSAPAPQHGSDLTDFLLRGKRGYCEQFAAAMALMARILGIPARVAMGYTPGTQSGPDEWIVRSQDAHAWPELYFEGAGWVRFEPTPGGPAGQGTASAPAYSEPSGSSSAQHPQGETEPSSGPSAGSTGRAAPNRGQHDRPDFGPTDDPRAEESDDSGGSSPAWLAGVLVVLLMALAVPMVVRVLARRRRWAAVTASPGRSPDAARAADPADAAHAAWGRCAPTPSTTASAGAPATPPAPPRAASGNCWSWTTRAPVRSAGSPAPRNWPATPVRRRPHPPTACAPTSVRYARRSRRRWPPAPAGAPACSPVHGRPDLGGRTIRGRPFHGGPHPPGRTGGPPPLPGRRSNRP